jgi:hypothetical protein
MDYKHRNAVSKVAHTTSVGNATFDIGSGLTDRFRKIYSQNFEGDTSGAYYADLAEKYTVDPEIELSIGTLIEVSDSDFDAELCDTPLSQHVIGVISESPGFLMNKGLEDSAVVGLVGTLPIKVIGPVMKKDILVSAGKGCLRVAETEDEYKYKVAISFETNDNYNEKLVKCFIK